MLVHVCIILIRWRANPHSRSHEHAWLHVLFEYKVIVIIALKDVVELEDVGMVQRLLERSRSVSVSQRACIQTHALAIPA